MDLEEWSWSAWRKKYFIKVQTAIRRYLEEEVAEGRSVSRLMDQVTLGPGGRGRN